MSTRTITLAAEDLANEISDEEIEALRTEAGVAGDLEMVTVCDRALRGDEDAIAECTRVVAEARDAE